MEHIKDFFSNAFSSRIRVVSAAMIIFAVVLISRLFYLQILNGSEYQDNYNLKLEKTETINATRGNIYDRNGKLLAYNELVYAVTIEDTGTYSSTDARNQSLNSEIAEIITKLESNGDSIDNNFGIYIDSAGQFEFMSSGSALQRFRADVFGRSSTDDLVYNENLGLDEANATADDIMNYLEGEHVYNISDSYAKKLKYEIAVIRYNMGQNSYQKYISTTIASDVSEESVAFIKENINELTGVDIAEKSLRRYENSEYFAHIIGYTGQISTDEYNTLSETDSTVETTDVIGKSGIEKYMNSYLSGTKGHETLYVDSVGNTIAVGDHVEAVSGNDVYLSIDADLQKAAYILLEQEIAGILYSKIANIKEYSASEDASSSEVVVPIYDVYYSLIDNQLIDVNAFEDENASENEKAVLAAYNSKKELVLDTLRSQLSANNTLVYNELPDEYQAYSTYIVTKLKSLGIFDSSAIDSSSDVQSQWTSEQMAVNQYLIYAIEQNWIDITSYESEAKYADTEELYEDLVDYIINYLSSDKDFTKLIYKYLILEDGISGHQLCLILYDQGVLNSEDDTDYVSLSAGTMTAYDFIKAKIKSLEITPGQLALDPCSGSTVVIDSKTGEVLACVTYPGYDNNKLANSVDSDYYAYLTNSDANPLYNYATQQRTAPGSTFKIVSSTAGLAEGVITTTSEITDLGIFEKVSNTPKCWVYPSNHGSINVSEAIRDSCNYFFYEVGFRLAGSENYDDEVGIKKIQQYASLFGLNDTTGIEIEENTPHLATEYPVMAAIGQSDNNFTTIGLARYACAIANSGTVYNLSLLDSVRDVDGNVLESYGPSVKNQVDVLDTSEWDAIHYGMKMVVDSLSSFNNFSVQVAGKTGTAQQVKSRPNHALFIGYAPYENPEVAIATRIAYGYTSHNAAKVSKDILAYYFGVSTTEDILNGEASTVSDSENEFTD